MNAFIFKVCIEVWMWVHWKYGMSWIVRNFYSVESNKCTYLTVINDSGTNIWNNVTCDLQYTYGKIMMILTIITYLMSTRCSINMQKSKQLYQYKNNNIYNENYFNNKDYDFKYFFSRNVNALKNKTISVSWCMNLSVSRIWNQSNRKKVVFIKIR